MELDYYRESSFGLCSITVTRVKTSIVKESTSERKKYFIYYVHFLITVKLLFSEKGKKNWCGSVSQKRRSETSVTSSHS